MLALKINNVLNDKLYLTLQVLVLKINSVLNDQLYLTLQILVLKISSVPNNQFVPGFTGIGSDSQ